LGRAEIGKQAGKWEKRVATTECSTSFKNLELKDISG